MKLFKYLVNVITIIFFVTFSLTLSNNFDKVYNYTPQIVDPSSIMDSSSISNSSLIIISLGVTCVILSASLIAVFATYYFVIKGITEGIIEGTRNLIDALEEPSEEESSEGEGGF
jgi:hypothetical protein